MNEFSNRTAKILTIITIMLLAAGCVLIIFSAELVPAIQYFLEKVIFHRSFSLDKWNDTIITLIGYPVFLTLFFNAIFFIKYNDKDKIRILILFLLCIAFLMIYCFTTRSSAYIDSDMASEILLAKECILSKSLWPRSWFYSTEIRLLNTQLISAPVFLFTNNWFIVKTITAATSCIILFFSQLFLLNSLNVKKTWVKFLTCIVSIAPCSIDIWLYVSLGNYYIPHIVLSFVYLALFFYLVSPYKINRKKYIFFFVLFWIASFMNGFATIRYLLIFVFPLALTICFSAVNSFISSKTDFSFKNFFIGNKKVLYSTGGLLTGCAGYLVNTTLLSKLYSFSQWNSTAYTQIGDITFTRLHQDFFSILGYKNNISAMTPAGIINLLIYIFIAFLIMAFVSFYKNKTKQEDNQTVYISFTLVSFIFTGFLYINTDYVARYFIMEFAFFVTCVAIFLEDISFKPLYKYILGVSFSIIFIGSSFTTIQTVLVTDKNANKHDVLTFLEKNNYTFGYATFWNANVFTYMSNGKIAIANLSKTKPDSNGVKRLEDHFSYEKWLTPDRYYEENYGKNAKCFLLVDSDEYNVSKSDNVFKNGKRVYEDTFYEVFEYSSPEIFKNSF